jgi:hypothetical protein
MGALCAGRGVWLRGSGGAGKGTVLSRLAEDVALDGACILLSDGPTPETGEDLLAQLLELSGAARPVGDVLSLAEALYVQLLEAFSRSGCVVVVPATGPLGDSAVEEVQILARLRVAGRPIVGLLLCGDGDSPVNGLEEVYLATPTPDDLRECLAHRLAGCGRPDLLSLERLTEIAAEARGLGDAVARARRELARLMFHGPVERSGGSAAWTSRRPGRGAVSPSDSNGLDDGPVTADPGLPTQ